MQKSIAAVCTAAVLLAGATGAQAHTTGPSKGNTALKAPAKAKDAAGATRIQLLTVSDWHGQIDPLGTGTTAVGGALALKHHLDKKAAEVPDTLTFMAGDSVGATPPISSFFADEPAIEVMNRLGVDADALGNHNFDAGLERLQRHVDLAEFPFLSANLPGLDEAVDGVAKRRFFDVRGLRVAVIGITNEEAPTLVAPGAFGPARVVDGVRAADKAARQARSAGADVVVVLTHKGVREIRADGTPAGELIDFTEAIDEKLIDVVVGDHTDFAYTGTHDGVLAVENRSKGATFSAITLEVDPRVGVVSKGAERLVPLVAGSTVDADLAAYLNGLRDQLQPILGTVIGDSTVAVLRSDSCGRSDGRLCESLVGNVTTDALRSTYGTQLAITNSGGLRAALTCPAAGAGAFCPASSSTPFPITRGGVLGVLPFGNVSATGALSGAEVKTFLEHGVSSMPGANGRFAQVSGLCFTYDIAAPVGNRVTSMVLQSATGSCSTTPLDTAASYTVSTNAFVAAGGDGFPNVLARFTTRNIMDQDLAAYTQAKTTIAPTLQDRIVCADSNGTTAPNCPAKS